MTPLEPEAIERVHGGNATYIRTEHVHETLQMPGSDAYETVWEGDVHVYETDHPQTDTCYAWAEPNEETGKDRIFAVLKLGPVQTPADAVRASILKDYHKPEQ